MRALSIGLICLAALAIGVLVAVVVARHPLEAARIYNDGAAVFVTAATPPPPDAAGWHNGVWTPPTDIPAHPNWTWQTPDGKTYQNVVITHLSSTEVAITHAEGVAHIPLDALPPDVQRELAYTPPADSANAAPAAVSLTTISALFDGKLVNSEGKPVATPGPAVKYYAIYYGAAADPRCKTFTPALVDWYHQFKPFHHNFELIFVSEDASEMDMYASMMQAKMPWPAVRYAELPRTAGTYRGPGIQQFAHDGIPDLVLVDSTGTIISDSFNGTTYLGPQVVLDYMNKNLSLN
jgi:hypothetical protein